MALKEAQEKGTLAEFIPEQENRTPLWLRSRF